MVQICSACTGLKGPATEYVRYFNFPPEVRASIKNPPLSLLLAHRQQCLSAPKGTSAPAPQTAEPQPPQLQQPKQEGDVGSPSPMQHSNGAQPQPQQQGPSASRSAPAQESAAPQLEQTQQQDDAESASPKQCNGSAQPQQQPEATLHSSDPPAQQSGAPQALQQAANNGLHRPEARYELGPDLKKVGIGKAPASPCKPNLPHLCYL
jgi:hypothetical protein